jgi:hypothetical protein
VRLGRRTASVEADHLQCSFCGKGEHRGLKIVRRDDGLFICTECVDKLISALAHSGGEPAALR